MAINYDVVDTDKVHVTVPDLEIDIDGAINALELGLKEVENIGGKFGSKRYVRSLYQAQKHLKLVSTHMEQAEATASYMSGVRVPRRKVNDKNRSMRRAFVRYLSILDNDELEMQGRLFNLGFNGQNSREDMIDQLVTKNVQMLSTSDNDMVDLEDKYDTNLADIEEKVDSTGE